MKTLKELGIPQIKCNNKEGTDYIKELQQRANDEMFKYRNRPLSPKAAKALIDLLTEIGVALKDAMVNNRQKPKRDEIQAQLRKIIPVLKQYRREEFRDSDGFDSMFYEQFVERVMGYHIKRLLRLKESGNPTDEEIINLLREGREIEEYYIKCMHGTLISNKYHNFYKTSEELLAMLHAKYELQNKESLKPLPLPVQQAYAIKNN